jgi:diaminopimelate epimerase
MRVGIRSKLVILLTVVALLPLLTALGVLVLGGRRLRRESFGQTLQAMASANARSLENALADEFRAIHLRFDEHLIVVQALDGAVATSPEARAELDRVWATLPDDDPRIRRVCEHPQLGPLLKTLRSENPRIAEILLTDTFGQLVAASGRTEDFYQADEDWWREAHGDGVEGRLHVAPVGRDVSADVWSISLCTPVTGEGRMLGVVKVVLKITPWLRQIDRTAAGLPAAVSLVHHDGRVLFIDDPGDGGTRPGTTRIELNAGERLVVDRPSWRQAPDGRIQAFSPIEMPQVTDRKTSPQPWLLGMELPEERVFSDVHALTRITLAVGLAVILALFVVGLLLAERSLVRRIRQLRRTTRDVAAGDLTRRVPVEQRRLLGRDEVDDLVADFNRMIDQVTDSYDALRTTHAMRTHFIRVAGHELRTPVSYILGMARLLADCDDPERVKRGVASMEARARRLEEIIQAIFKLLPARESGGMLETETVAIGPLLDELRVDCLPFVQRRGQQLTVECDDLPEIRADRARLRDAVENLIMNAVRFTPDGGTVRVAAREEPEGHVSVSVTDEGPGIDESQLQKIFEPFYGADDVMKHSSAVGYSGAVMSGTLEFSKLSGSGNDFVCVDNRDGALDALLADPEKIGRFARALCRRGMGVGADGVILAVTPEIEGAADIGARFFEADGSETELCGNGTACFARWAAEAGYVHDGEVSILTAAGVVLAKRADGSYVRICLPVPDHIERDVEIVLDGFLCLCDFAMLGVPHAVIYVDDVARADVARLGPLVRHHERFAPAGINANFVQILGPGRIALRTYEYGVEGETLACGTGSASAAMLSAIRYNWCDRVSTETPVEVDVRSGDVLKVYFDCCSEGTISDPCLETTVRFAYRAELSADLAAEALDV